MVRFGMLDKMSHSAQKYAMETLVDKNVREFREKYCQKPTTSTHTIRMMTEEKQMLQAQLDVISNISNKNDTDVRRYHEIKAKMAKTQNIIDGLSNNDEVITNYKRTVDFQIMQNAQIICTTLMSSIKLMR